MAKVTVVRGPVVEPPIQKVVLEMSLEEARGVEALAAGCEWFSVRNALNSPDSPAKGSKLLNAVTDALEAQLEKAGIALIRL